MPPDGNRLGGETSPYLLQHADNPVHWRPWGAEALAEAKRRDWPILLSVGYAACHWCHVMAHESFEDADTAALMNRLFVNIKVDREERPDIDHLHERAARAGRAGRLAADDVPDAGRRAVLGRNLFAAGAALGPAVVPPGAAGVADAWRDKRQALLAQGAGARRPFDRVARAARRVRASCPDDTDARRDALLRADRSRQRRRRRRAEIPQRADLPLPLENEFFPQRRRALPRRRRAASLDALCAGGIYDHLGGGFARYSTDARVAGAAFREDALRQRADSRIARPRPRRGADAALRRAGARDLRLADARDARRRRLRFVAGRRFAGRGGPLLCLERRRDRCGARRRRGAVQGRLRRASGRQLGGPQRAAARDAAGRRGGRGAARVRPRAFVRDARDARQAGARRQNPRRLERAGDRGAGARRRRLRGARVSRRGARGVRFRRWDLARRRRPARSRLARRALRRGRHARRLRRHGARRVRACSRRRASRTI